MMASNNLSNISTEKLRKRKKIGLILVWILIGIVLGNIVLLIYLMSQGRWDTMKLFSLVLLPFGMGLIMLAAVLQANKELNSRIE